MENKAMTGLKEEDSEIELELGLAIGGSIKRAETLEPIKKDIPSYSEQPPIRNTKPNTFSCNVEENLSVFDPSSKRKIHALRRQQAKKKREEKQQKKGLFRGKNGICRNGNDFEFEERDCKKNKIEDHGSGNHHAMRNVNLKVSIKSNTNLNNVRSYPNAVAGPGSQEHNPYPYQYAMPHFPPFANAFTSHRDAVAFWPMRGFGNVVRAPLVNRSFRRYPVGHVSGIIMANGRDSEPNSVQSEGGKRKTASNGSPICSSSIVSDLPNSSLQAGSSSDSGTHSTQTKSEPSGVNGSCNTMAQSDYTAISHQMESAAPKTVLLVSRSAPKEEPNSGSQSISANSATTTKASTTTTTTTTTTMTETKSEMCKPPKPQTQKDNTHIPSAVPHMPCVSTTGNGPNGKTINGFLYRYTTSEVSIVCVCHGSSFSPAEFVQHAGGVDVTHPLKHITVTPSAF